MPIIVPRALPGVEELQKERVPMIFEERAFRQDIRPLRIALVNLMPNKIATEVQLLRALGSTPLQVEITLLHMESHTSKNTPWEHLEAFYKTHKDVADQRFDGLIMTGAPVDHLPYEEVTYWDEVCRVIDWAETNVYSRFYICWGAMAALRHFHGVPMHIQEKKTLGVYPQRLLDLFDPLVTGFDEGFSGPVARMSHIKKADVVRHANLKLLVETLDGDPCILHDEDNRRIYALNHLEYDANALQKEYERDVGVNLPLDTSPGYFAETPDAPRPKTVWRAHRSLLFRNWINIVYQGTPYDLNEL